MNSYDDDSYRFNIESPASSPLTLEYLNDGKNSLDIIRYVKDEAYEAWVTREFDEDLLNFN